MKRVIFYLLAIGALVVLSACGAGNSSSSSASSSGSSKGGATAAPASLTVRTVNPYGQILADGSGRTVYLFEADTGTASTCSGACARAWPPLLASGAPMWGVV